MNRPHQPGAAAGRSPLGRAADAAVDVRPRREGVVDNTTPRAVNAWLGLRIACGRRALTSGLAPAARGTPRRVPKAALDQIASRVTTLGIPARVRVSGGKIPPALKNPQALRRKPGDSHEFGFRLYGRDARAIGRREAIPSLAPIARRRFVDRRGGLPGVRAAPGWCRRRNSRHRARVGHAQTGYVGEETCLTPRGREGLTRSTRARAIPARRPRSRPARVATAPARHTSTVTGTRRKSRTRGRCRFARRTRPA